MRDNFNSISTEAIICYTHDYTDYVCSLKKVNLT